MIKLIKEFLHTGIAAHKKSIEESNKAIAAYETAIKGWQISSAYTKKCMLFHDCGVYNAKVNRDIRIERLSKLKRLTNEQSDQLKSDMLIHNYCQENNID